jgi:hypothetical protein
LLPAEKGEEHKSNQPDKRKESFWHHIYDEISRPYSDHFIDAVSALPRQDLAKMAEALVSLTAFLMRMRTSQYETVAEPIDVAVLSKGDGFIWVKHKNLVREADSLAI